MDITGAGPQTTGSLDCLWALSGTEQDTDQPDRSKNVELGGVTPTGGQHGPGDMDSLAVGTLGPTPLSAFAPLPGPLAPKGQPGLTEVTPP